MYAILLKGIQKVKFIRISKKNYPDTGGNK